MSLSPRIDLSLLPAPTLLEPLNAESILQEALSELATHWSDASTLLPSDPAYAVLETFAYREFLLRARVNEAYKQTLLAYATGTNLDQLAGLYGLERLVLDAGNPTALPPIPPTYESDTAFRHRVVLSLDAVSTAGSVDSYRYHALSASGNVADVGITCPSAGVVQVVVLSRVGNGVPESGLLSTVSTALNADTVRPLCDTVSVLPASLRPYSVTATLTLGTGADSSLVLALANTAVSDYVASCKKVGALVAVSGVYQALHQAGVQKVTLSQPTTDVQATALEAPHCTSITIVQG
jgi:phage-related baseplate assembly protein